MSSQLQPQSEWIKILNKGIITIPKKMRTQIGIQEGDMAKISLQENKIVIEAQDKIAFSQFRTFTDKEINIWIKEDKLPEKVAKETAEYWKNLP